MMTVGRSMAMIPGYSKAKDAAIRIIQLHNRKSEINPHNNSGIILVPFLFQSSVFYLLSLFQIFRMK